MRLRFVQLVKLQSAVFYRQTMLGCLITVMDLENEFMSRTGMVCSSLAQKNNPKQDSFSRGFEFYR
uniref:Uncharacterized protein n=1 Tax=Anguilla anguilla TaxID=7936 RepID=A0A0E9WN03_ANGAN